MPDDTPSSSFPKTSEDISNLKQTAETAKGQMKEMGSHAVFEAQNQLGQAKDSFIGLVSSVKTYAGDRPFLCLGLAFGLGFIVGKAHHHLTDND